MGQAQPEGWHCIWWLEEEHTVFGMMMVSSFAMVFTDLPVCVCMRESVWERVSISADQVPCCAAEEATCWPLLTVGLCAAPCQLTLLSAHSYSHCWAGITCTSTARRPTLCSSVSSCQRISFVTLTPGAAGTSVFSPCRKEHRESFLSTYCILIGRSVGCHQHVKNPANFYHLRECCCIQTVHYSESARRKLHSWQDDTELAVCWYLTEHHDYVDLDLI